MAGAPGTGGKRKIALFQCAEGQGTSKRARRTEDFSLSNEDGNFDLPDSDSDLD